MDKCEILDQHFNVSRETYERLKLYQSLLLKWQNKINLVSQDTIENLWQRHFIDSLQLLPLIGSRSLKALDIGSGAGFPGMVLAIAGMGDMHLVECDGKKTIFLNEVARITNTNVVIHHGRTEDIDIDDGKIILSRACSALSKLFFYASKYVSRETKCLFHKGKNYQKELLDCEREWLFDYIVHPSVTDAQGVVLEVTNLRKK